MLSDSNLFKISINFHRVISHKLEQWVCGGIDPLLGNDFGDSSGLSSAIQDRDRYIGAEMKGINGTTCTCK